MKQIDGIPLEQIEIIKAYFSNVEKAAYEEVMALFTEDAIVDSPLFGMLKAGEFFKKLFASTNSSKIAIINIFFSANDPGVVAAHFQYDWTLNGKTQVPFECIDVFEFSFEPLKITKLKIIYDASLTKAEFEKYRQTQAT